MVKGDRQNVNHYYSYSSKSQDQDAVLKMTFVYYQTTRDSLISTLLYSTWKDSNNKVHLKI